MRLDFVFLVLFLLSYSVSSSAEDVPKDIVIIKENSVHLAADEDQITLNFEVEVIEGFFAYQEKFEINLYNFNTLNISIDPIVSFFDKTFQKTKKGVKKSAKFQAGLLFSSQSPPETLEIELAYQACTPEFCLFPTKTTITHTLTSQERDAIQQSMRPKWLKKGLFLSILFVYLAGLLTSLTPCVYPMLPITIAVLGANKSTSKLDGFIKSLTYVLGMALTYATLGLFAASTGFMFGSLLSNYYFLGVLTIILFLGALSMFDVFEIQTPHGLLTRLSVSQKSTSYMALFVTGLFSGLVVGPCVGPVLVGILGYVSQTGSLILGFSLLFTFAIGLGLLILVLGTFSGLIDKLPRSGKWMVSIKKGLGLMFLVLIIYFVSPVVSFRQLTVLSFTLLLIFSLVLLVKNNKLKNTYLNQIEWAFYKSILIFSFLSILITVSITNERFERLIGYSAQTFANTHWDVYSEEKLEIAKQNSQFVVVDFYADWCAACRELKNKTFSDPKVYNYSQNIKWLYFDSTYNSEKLKELKQKYNILGLPTVLFFQKNGVLRDDLRITGFEDSKSFIERLKKLTSVENL